MKKKKLHLRKILKYDMMTGIFYSRTTGEVVGKIDDEGYIQIWINKKKYQAEELAWRYVSGEWPKYPVIHMDNVRSNNWINNLTMPTVRKIYKNSKSKITGVYRNKKNKRWRAQISVNGKPKPLGSFEKFDLAVIARYQAEVLYGYDSDSPAHRHIKNMFL